jgi:hypothetical protein
VIACLIAAGVATTKYTQEDRSICKNLDDLDNVPELDDFEQALLSTRAPCPFLMNTRAEI